MTEVRAEAVPVAPGGDAAARIDALLAEFAADPMVAARADDLVRAVVDFYDDGLNHLVTGIDEAGGGGLLAQAATDPVVASLLVLHDLHPVPLHDRVVAALDQVRPYLGSHAGDVDLLGIEEDAAAGGYVVRVRLTGSCDGCPASSVTMRDAIERAIAEVAPEVVGVEADGVQAGGDGASGVVAGGVESSGVAAQPVAGGRTLLPVVGSAS